MLLLIKLIDMIEEVIFNIFIFCMFIILGVLFFGLLKWIYGYLKLCYKHNNWKFKILVIFPISSLITIPLLLAQALIQKGYIELIIAIVIGSIGSHYIFKSDDKNDI